jgi:hypothetical protein
MASLPYQKVLDSRLLVLPLHLLDNKFNPVGRMPILGSEDKDLSSPGKEMVLTLFFISSGGPLKL